MTALARGVIIYMERKLNSLEKKCCSGDRCFGWYYRSCYTTNNFRFNGECNWLCWKFIYLCVARRVYRCVLGMRKQWVLKVRDYEYCHVSSWCIPVYNCCSIYNHCRCDSPVYVEIGPWFSFIQRMTTLWLMTLASHYKHGDSFYISQ